MKKDLTDTQKEIIATIERAFVALNESNKEVPFNLININKIQAEANRIKVGKENLKIHNEAVIALRNELVEKLARQFNQDFERGNMPIEVTIGACHGINFNAYKLGYQCDRHFSLELRPKGKSVEFGQEWLPEFEYAENCVAKEKFNTVEEFINSDYIQKKLLVLYQYITERYPECKR